MERVKYTYRNCFGDFESPKSMVDHLCAIFGGEDGFFASWARLLDFDEMAKRVNLEPDAYDFADGLREVLEGFDIA